MNFAEILYQNGVVVIPVFNSQDLQLYHQAFWNTVKTFPEYLHPDSPDTIYVMGAFGALGNPASFHNPMVRNLRLNMMFRAVPLFSQINQLEGKIRNLEQMPDRMSIRRMGTSLGRETWHRDQAPSRDEDDIFGGWVNLDLDFTQKFSCIPRTQIPAGQNKTGTGFLREIDIDESQKVIYEVPPGHWIVFYQNILHEVLSGKIKQNSIRVFTGFRLTPHNEPLFDQRSAFENQGILRQPGGNLPPMFARNHLSFHASKLIEWSNNTFKPECLELKNTPKLGEYSLVHRYMKSLIEYNFPLYPIYTEEELSIFQPRNQWMINNQELAL